MNRTVTKAVRIAAKRRLYHIRHLDPIIAQRRAFRSLLAAGQSTRFGRDHEFFRLTTVADYQAAVPLRRFEDFWDDYWSADFPILDNVTWPGRIPYFALTSGTGGGASKHIPLTHRTLRQNRRAAFDMLSAHLKARKNSDLFSGISVVLGGSTKLSELAPGIFSGDLSGIVNETAPPWLRPFTFPPRDLAQIENWEEKVDAFVEAAVDLPVRSVSGIPSWLLFFFERLEARYGRWPWPEMELLVHGGVPWRPYASRFQPYLDATEALTREVYPASEGFIAFADRGPQHGLLLSTDTGLFFEFVPLEELDADRPIRHWIANVELGVDYALVLTTPSGLWSYVIGDTVQFVELDPPRIVVSGRTAYMLSAFGEHVIESELELAITAAVEGAGAKVAEFCVGARMPANGESRGQHVMLIETADRATGCAELGPRIDARLSELNDDYRAHRQAMQPPEIHLLPPGTFERWLRSVGKLGGQHKVPRVIADPERFSAAAESILSAADRARTDA